MASHWGSYQHPQLELLLADSDENQERVSSLKMLDKLKEDTISEAVLGQDLTNRLCRNLIRKHARLQAVKPVMWGGRTPTAAGIEKLATACMDEWTRALTQMLRHWEAPPSTTGR